jgi:hypothetical protein
VAGWGNDAANQLEGLDEMTGPTTYRRGEVTRNGRCAPPRARGIWRIRLWIFSLAGVALFWAHIIATPRAGAQQVSEAVVNREYTLKALFLYNFGSYIEWPAKAYADDKSPFVIGILGNAPLDATLQEIANTKKIAGRKVVLQRFETVEKLKPCNILFIPRGVPAEQQQAAIDAMKDKPVLVVGETEGFANRGGAVNFFVEQNKIRFEINTDIAKQQQLKVSAKLLALAKIISSESPPPADSTTKVKR